ncbi:unnamed protein product [Tuber aestivum]|uniref:Granulins domain-containing protein n=1 Tax=Tuber aestivum TaxID=59557 RepID=A0A292Q2M8_9PEZI|nr:unnamed protein product [Tuber aestivum]
MKSIFSVVAFALFVLTVAADSNGFKATLRGGLARRSTPLDSIPKLFVRQTTCPSETPTVCDVQYCGQVCCGYGDGSYCLFGEKCQTNGCCKVGQTCIDLGVTESRDEDDVKEAAKSNSGSSRGTGIAAALFVGAAVAAL